MAGRESGNSGEGYTLYKDGNNDFFFPVMLVCVLLFGGAGYYLKINNPPPVPIREKVAAINQTRFIIEEPKPKQVHQEKKTEIKKNKPIEEKPIDLTEKPLLNQEKDEIVEKPPLEKKKKVRRVYGLKKVYSMGIGASGSAADAIIGKRGNTLNTAIDTITATESDFKGEPVSITRVTRAPRIKKAIKPEYTPEMIEKRIEGTVRANILVDIDGRVKQVIVLDDLGYGSKQMVADAWFKSFFEPAMIDDRPVPTWITVKVRFKMLSG
jgi:hypothetical protein